MADCDLCGVAIPTTCPVRVFSPRFENSYPEGVWKGLCSDCLEAVKDAQDDSGKLTGSFGKCDLCSKEGKVQDVTVNIH